MDPNERESMNTPQPTSQFPPVLLLPVVDAHHAWSALLLEVLGAFDGNVLTRLFGEFGLYGALDTFPCIVSLPDPASLVGELAGLLPADRVVLRVPAAVCADPAHRDALQQLRDTGFRLMADGLAAAGTHLGEAITSIALPYPEDALPANVSAAMARLPGPHLVLGVKTQEQHANGLNMGFNWFIGNYLLHSEKGKEAANPHHQALLLQLLALVAADADSHQMEAIFKQDAHLSYQLLKLVNSVAFSLSSKITSFSQAITLLGRRQLQRWLQLLLYAHAQGAGTNPLMPRAALRAELMESMCAGIGGDREGQDRAYMVGMFSLLDLLFGMTIEEIIAPLNLADDVALALTERSGVLGAHLRVVEAGEGDSGHQLATALADAGIDTTVWAGALVHAYHWAIPISRES